MAITCPSCGAEFDATLFEFGHCVECLCGTVIEYPGADLRAGHLCAQREHKGVIAQPVQDPGLLLQIAHAAAEQLVVDLEEARQLTAEWKDEELTDALVEAAFAKSLQRLAETDCWGEANRLPGSEFWRIAGPWLEAGALQRHARLKPQGYAGDHQMLDWIWTDYRCDHPLGRAFDRYFQRQAAPQAVRNRTRQTAALMVAHCLRAGHADYQVVSVGSGPGADICQALATLPESRRARVRVTLLDLAPEALEFSECQLAPLLQAGALRCIRENLYRLPQKRNLGSILGEPNFLICSGLFDYLNDETAIAMLRVFWGSLAEGGLLLVGNFAPHNPTRAYMEWVGDWHLNYRTGMDLERLAIQAEIPKGNFSIGSEELGVNLFVTARK